MGIINKAYTAALTNAAPHYGMSTNAWQLPGLSTSVGLITLHNPTGSGLVMRVYSVRWVNLAIFTASVSLSFFELWRVTSPLGGQVIPCIPWTWDGDRSIQRVSAMTNAASTPVEQFARACVSLDEFAFQGNDMDAWESSPNLNVLWDSGIDDANVQPIVIREGYGFEVTHHIDGSANPSQFAPTFISMWVDFTLGVS